MDKYPLKKYPIIGVCGLNCGLCPRYHTEGTSRCPGCCGPDFFQKHPSCGFITCCVKQRNLETCALCAERNECEKVAKVVKSATFEDSFISYRPVPDNFAFIGKCGIEEFARLEVEKIKFLKKLIDNYDDGRSKSVYCTSCQLIPLDKLEEALAEAVTVVKQDNGIKEKAGIVKAAINNMAKRLGIDLKLRK